MGVLISPEEYAQLCKVKEGEAILSALEGLGIELEPVTWQQMWHLDRAGARQFDRSAYDAAYLALAEVKGQPLITGDQRLYNAVRGTLDWVWWIGDVP